MNTFLDGPSSTELAVRSFVGNTSLSNLAKRGLSKTMIESIPHAPNGDCTCWGIPFRVNRPIHAKDKPVRVAL